MQSLLLMLMCVPSCCCSPCAWLLAVLLAVLGFMAGLVLGALLQREGHFDHRLLDTLEWEPEQVGRWQGIG